MGLAPSGQNENTANLLHAEVPVPIDSHRRWAGWAVAALLWNLICWPVGLTVLRDGGQQQVVTSIVWLVLTEGIWLAWVALREYLRQRRYGQVLPEIQPWPYRAGHQLQGQIRFGEVIPEVQELAVELRVME